ncbi:hypothetical protein C8R44DRAFT_270315 [Mycena epipterygia]|nr:hypothetical protein C8R44DRAFT_270315 [Mycena epipterygia]
MSGQGQIFNVEEASHPSEFQTSAAQAQVDAPTGTIAREVEANAEQAKDVAENAAFVAQSKGPELTGQSATDRLQNDVSLKTSAAVDQGQHDVAAAQATGAGYIDQAKSVAANAVATAQSYIPAGTGPDGAHTTGDVVSGLQAGASAVLATTKEYALAAHETAKPHIQAGANAALATGKEYLAAAQETAQPHIEKAKGVAQSYMPGSTTTTQTAPVSEPTIV